jgi:subtilisin family serine protease
VSGPRFLRLGVLVLGASLSFALVPSALGAQRPAQAFADPAFGWRNVSGHDLHSALVRKPWARVVVALRPSSRPLGDAVSRAGVSTIQGRVLRSLRAADFRLTERWSEIPAVAGFVSRSGLPRLTANPDVLRVDLDVGGRADDAQSLRLVHGDSAHSKGFLGSGVTVAVIDSGVQSSHPDLVGRVVDEHCFCANPDGGGCCQAEATDAGGPGSANDDNGHGTNVAGIISSAGTLAPKGVAPAANIVAVKVLASDGSFASTAQVISGLNWVMENHPEVRVVNMSLGTTALFSDSCDSATAYTLAFASAINTFRSRGGLVFVSSGNAAAKNAMSAPACLDGAVAVGAVYDSDVGGVSFPTANCADETTVADQVTCFSNSSPALDLLAPGAMITSTGLDGGLSTYAGTSQACPHAAGAAAVLFAASPTLSGAAIEGALKSSGQSVVDVANGRVTPRVDVAAALEGLGATSPASPPSSGTSSPPAILLPPPPLAIPPAAGLDRRPRIEVAPARLDFSRVRARSFATREVTIRNVGDHALRVDPPARLKQPFSFAKYPGSLSVPRGGWVRVKLVFRPSSAGRFAATVLIRSDDSTRPQVAVRLTGVGTRR